MRFKVAESNIINSYDKPVIGLERDGVINFRGENGYVWTPEQFKPIPGSLEAMALMRRKGYRIVIITNQSGISKGIYTQEDLEKTNKYMFELLGQAGCPSIDGLLYSINASKEDLYVKPNIGMFQKAEKDLRQLNIKFSEGWYIGDSLNDLKCAVKTKSKPVLVRTGDGKETEKELNKYTYKNIKNQTLIFDNLMAFAESLK